MAFKRIKKINGNLYLYLVENTWVNGKVKQKTLKYCGRVDPYKKEIVNPMVVFNRDSNKCMWCGSTKELTIDHKIPLSKGGEDTYNNCWTLCRKCNQSKSNKTIQDLIREKKEKETINFLKDRSIEDLYYFKWIVDGRIKNRERILSRG